MPCPRIVPALVLAALMPTLAIAAPAAKSSTKSTDPFDQSRYQGLEWRNLGPARGGRVTAVTGVPGQRSVYYFGATGGGIWKSVDSGMNWTNVSDGELGAGSVGAVAVAPSDPNIVYAGMGEGCIRGNVSHGDGVYKSYDAGKTWTNVGLRDSRQIGRIRIHPRDPDLVYVAALGHPFGPNHERGVFRSRDGGTTWSRVLGVNDSTGAIDVVMDAKNPRVLYAGTWQVQRTPWSFESGGAGSGLWKTSDGGDTWKRLTGEGLPKGVWGRVGVAVSPVQPDRVWAMVEAEEGGLFRSDDAGRTWRRTSEDRNLRQRAWYYSHVYADPRNAEVVYVLNVQMMRSGDGGRTFRPIPGPHGDHHDLWIDPDDPQRMINGNDGGACVSFDGGLSWSSLLNQPTAQFYHVITDDGFPYRVYGAQQDNSTISIPSRTDGFGIGSTDWYPVGGGESGYIAPKPGERDIVYAGSYGGYLTRHDHRTGQERNVNPHPENPMGWGAGDLKHRFQWTFPIIVSPHDPNTVYAASHVVHRSTDEGHSWQVISPDLTRNDPKRMGPSGGPVTKDNTSVEYYCTIFALAESRRTKGLLWVGSDDGRVHVSRDGGGHWQDVTPSGLPAWSMVSQIDPSPHDPGTAWLAVNRYKLDDPRPYVYVTRDYGKSWRSIAGDLPADAFVRVVREDPVRKNILFTGTELGLYWSLDGGAHWRPLRMNLPGRTADPNAPDGEAKGALPLVPITDLVVHENDLVVATQGRSFWVLDQIGVLRESTRESGNATAWLYTPGAAQLFGGPAGGGEGGAGANPLYGAVIDYRLAREPKDNEEVTLEFLDSSGKSLRKFSNKPEPDEEADAAGGEEGGGFGRRAPRKIPAKAGLNRFAWDLRLADASRFKGLILWGGGLQGPQIVPGNYQVRLTAYGVTQTRPFEVRRDPRLEITAADYQKRYELHVAIRDKLTETHEAIGKIRDARDQIKAVSDRAKIVTPKDSAIAVTGKALIKDLTAVEEALYQTKNKSSQDPLNYPIRLNNKLANLVSVLSSADAAPTEPTRVVYQDVVRQIDAELAKLKVLLGERLTAFNQLVRDKSVPAVVLKEKKPTGGTSATASP